MDIGYNIKTIREAKRIRQIEVAESLEVDNSYYAKLEKRGNKLTIEQLEKIAGALGVTIRELIFGDSSENNKGTAELQSKIDELQKRNEVLEADYNRQKDMFDIMLPFTKEAVEFFQMFKSLINSTEDSENSLELTESQRKAINEVRKLLQDKKGENGKFLGLF